MAPLPLRRLVTAAGLAAPDGYLRLNDSVNEYRMVLGMASLKVLLTGPRLGVQIVNCIDFFGRGALKGDLALAFAWLAHQVQESNVPLDDMEVRETIQCLQRTD